MRTSGHVTQSRSEWFLSHRAAISLAHLSNVLLPKASQIGTGGIRRGHFLNLQHHYGRNEDANNIDNGQQSGHDSTDQELGRNVVRVDKLIGGVPGVCFALNMRYLDTVVDQPNARQCPVNALKTQ